jgi:lipoate-protein ligase A
VRRHSGGGAVYHDLGNSNFSFIEPKSLHNKNTNADILLHALAACGVEGAVLHGRNDVVHNGVKISGIIILVDNV